MRWRAIQENFDGLYFDAQGGWESRQFKFTLSYLFGNQTVKAAKRKAGLEDETKRVSSGGQ